MSTIRVAPLGPLLSAAEPGSDGPARVQALMNHLSESAGHDVSWPDEGAEVLSQPWDPHPLHAVRSLAAHTEYPAKTLGITRKFKLRSDPRSHPGLQKIFQGANTSFPHLMRHSDNKGLWIPAPLPGPVVANEEQWWMVGSVDGVIAELGRLSPLLEGAGASVREAWDALHQVFGSAHEARLPVVID